MTVGEHVQIIHFKMEETSHRERPLKAVIGPSGAPANMFARTNSLDSLLITIDKKKSGKDRSQRPSRKPQSDSMSASNFRR